MMQQHKTVLLVEDDAALRELMAEILTDEGYAVLEAKDGRHGLRLAQEHMPSLILADQVLPAMSGIELLERLRASRATRSIPVVLVSGRPADGGSLQPDEVIDKPFDLDVLLSHVERLAASN
jgi:CheY-like chemotaxis protein